MCVSFVCVCCGHACEGRCPWRSEKGISCPGIWLVTSGCEQSTMDGRNWALVLFVFFNSWVISLASPPPTFDLFLRAFSVHFWLLGWRLARPVIEEWRKQTLLLHGYCLSSGFLPHTSCSGLELPHVSYLKVCAAAGRHASWIYFLHFPTSPANKPPLILQNNLCVETAILLSTLLPETTTSSSPQTGSMESSGQCVGVGRASPGGLTVQWGTSMPWASPFPGRGGPSAQPGAVTPWVWESWESNKHTHMCVLRCLQVVLLNGE